VARSNHDVRFAPESGHSAALSPCPLSGFMAMRRATLATLRITVSAKLRASDDEQVCRLPERHATI
jgi:hypothetical protein